MSFLVLQTTGDFGLTAATLTASIIASLVVRETFGYSFSTWRLHLRGETIRSAHDVGWLRTLTAGRMMRTDPRTIAAAASLAEFRRRFPLGSTRRAIALDDDGHYAGIVPTSAVYADEDGEGVVSETDHPQGDWLTPEMTIKEHHGRLRPHRRRRTGGAGRRARRCWACSPRRTPRAATRRNWRRTGGI